MQEAFLSIGSQVALRTMSLADQSIFQHWLANNAELRRLIDNPHVPTMADQLAWFTALQASTDRQLFSIVTYPDNVLIGNGGFVDINRVTHCATFRITIGNVDFIGKGFGTEAARLLLRYGFNQLDFHDIRLSVLATNTRAIASYKKVGFCEVANALDVAHPAIIHMMLNRASFLSS